MASIHGQSWRHVRREIAFVAHPARWAMLLVLFTAVFAGLLLLNAEIGKKSGPDEFVPQASINWLKAANSVPGVQIALILISLVGSAYAFRRYRQALFVRRPGPLVVREFQNATGEELPLLELGTSFRNFMGEVHLASPAPVPGASSQTEFLELLKTASTPTNPLAAVAGILGLTRVTHAIEVTATLRVRESALPCGVTVNVSTLPRGGADPVTVWSSNWTDAVRQAAIATGAAILPRTKLCKRAPWHDWQGKDLPTGLFSDYLEAKSLTEQHRYDEALGKYFSALRYDPKNLYIRLEIGALQEQLQLFLDALESYDDLIALGSRRDERRLEHVRGLLLRARREDPSLPSQPTPGPLDVLGSGWKGNRGLAGVRPPAWPHRSRNVHEALLIARYRYSMVLGFSEVLLAQWIRQRDSSDQTHRERESKRLRSRLVARLAHYRPDARAGAGTGYEVLHPVTPTDDVVISDVSSLRSAYHEALQLVASAMATARRSPACTSESHAHFDERFQGAVDLLSGTGAITVKSVELALRAVLAAGSVCPDKDWSDLKSHAKAQLSQFQRRRTPEAMSVLRAQEFLQRAALTEVEQMIKDYRIMRGRRRRGMVISQRALRLSKVWAELRLERVESQISAAVAVPREPPREPAQAWPPHPRLARTRIDRASRGVRTMDWQEHYVAACAYSIPLLSRRAWAGSAIDARLPAEPDSWDGHLSAHGYSVAAVRALERAMDSRDSHIARGRPNWLLAEDPDLIGLRTRPEYARFRLRNVPSAERPLPTPKNVHVLQLSTYVTEIALALAASGAQQWRAMAEGLDDVRTPVLEGALGRDGARWRMLVLVAREHRDWRVRLAAIEFLRTHQRTVSDGEVTGPYPSYPDPRIGDLSLWHELDERHVTRAATHAVQERRYQLERIASMVEGALGHHDLVRTRIARRHRRSVVEARYKAWSSLEAALSVKFFTPDADGREALLEEAVARESKLERHLLAMTRALQPEGQSGTKPGPQD